MYALNVILRVTDDKQHAVISTKHCFAGMERTVYSSNISDAMGQIRAGEMLTRSMPDLDYKFVGVRMSYIKEHRPHWLVTEEELIKRYEAMQQDKGPPLEGELLDAAKQLWAGLIKRVK